MFSFNATKCLATGEGGMIAASQPALLEYMRVLRDGDDHARMRDRIASPLTDLQAALGLSQLARYDSFLLRRKAIAEIYFEELKDCPIDLPGNVRARSIFFRFPVLTGGDFDRQRAQFSALGVHVRRGVDQLLHRLVREDAADYPSAERTFEATVSLPLYPALTDVEVEQIVAACRAVWN
jgi:UDP-4-amino-4-deoxy-L-arabinose-oxoglutarate aminotransferase